MVRNVPLGLGAGEDGGGGGEEWSAALGFLTAMSDPGAVNVGAALFPADNVKPRHCHQVQIDP